ncbi:Leucine-rich repeat protein kinase family protein [Arabidopsis thaliana]|uniref:Leucine-rich repeat protein kinase family protein n=1 Tax=Arabidopsis thaliana TaxID=3702 RepID=A0A1P8BEK6_ARATH|nr:Leucine-rich repeat protein kinase family protein [Arabidopsis thaliana]ANM70038.1 Leucine-rich repeat protein kinase family protein [Arabidopsis thaliana]|eukprot:NP_001331676.1 Leucine-rich repeat protein kinase family protein [Arabidopsis thaliana]
MNCLLMKRVSLDCGSLRMKSSYVVEKTVESEKILRDTLSRTLRYFPDGIRNCYNLNVEKGRTHLIVARFVYGNYDGFDLKPKFDLYLGPNLWATVDLQTEVNDWGNYTANIGFGIMGNGSYITKSGSLNLLSRTYLSKSGSDLRYMKDVYDRTWVSYGASFRTGWTQIYTALEVNNSNNYAPPKDALRNAATPTNASAPLTIEWPSGSPSQEVPGTNITFFSDPIIPKKLDITSVQSVTPKTCQEGKCSLQLTRTNRSTLPPLLNALEIYAVIQFPQSETNEIDVIAIKKIEAMYESSRINWQGDPCVPQHFIWDGLNCSNTDISTPPRITSLNLSSSGLTGNIAAAIQNLTQLEKLDLSNNNLTGGVPEFLGNMKSLSFIGNNLSGSIPQTLQKKRLELFVEGNPRLCLSDSCRKPPKKKIHVAIVASVASAAIVVAVLILFLILRKRKSTIVQGQHLPPSTSTVDVTFANKKSKRFTYLEVIKMTNNFQRVLGKGGFGMVYHGTVKGSDQVAVKVLSQSSTQGYKQFKAEALIYEFLPNGDLKQHLSGKGGKSIINWSIRLQIALNAALGLEYLHIGCIPPMVHRDVKTANILLDENFKAKLADFGLSRSFQVRGESYDSTFVAGTPGYLDPEYYPTSRLAAKSDVYSYGIVLLEMITNQPVISEKYHITEWVGSKLNRGDIIEIMDPNLGGVYDSNSAWRALELAMSCADPSSSKRPTMSQVINELKECLVCENSRMSKTRGMEYQEMNISLDTSVVPGARYPMGQTSVCEWRQFLNANQSSIAGEKVSPPGTADDEEALFFSLDGIFRRRKPPEIIILSRRLAEAC